MREFLRLDPATLYLPPSRRNGPDRGKSLKHFSRHGTPSRRGGWVHADGPGEWDHVREPTRRPIEGPTASVDSVDPAACVPAPPAW